MYKLGQPLLTLTDVSVKFGTKTVLRDISVCIKDIIGQDTLGQVTTLLGKSGSGKSTLFKTIAGLLKPTTGQVLIGPDQTPIVQGVVGMVLQQYPLLMHRTLRSNLDLVNNNREKVSEYLSEFELWEHRDKYPAQLSGGQRQRGAIVQQLLCSEHFTLLDEPFSGLDPVATDKLCKMVTKAANLDNYNTIIISSHILEPSIAISDSIWVLGHEYISNPGDIIAKPREKVEGAKILHTEDLAEQGLAWNPEIRRDPYFTQKVDEIRQLFHRI